MLLQGVYDRCMLLGPAKTPRYEEKCNLIGKRKQDENATIVSPAPCSLNQLAQISQRQSLQLRNQDRLIGHFMPSNVFHVEPSFSQRRDYEIT